MSGTFEFTFSNHWKADRIRLMKYLLLLFVSCLSFVSFAEELPPAPQILAAARAQLPPHPVVMTGVLKQWAANGFMKKALDVEMTLDWSAQPPRAEYHINDPKKKVFQTLEVSAFYALFRGQPDSCTFWLKPLPAI